jgi:hypothetical protein
MEEVRKRRNANNIKTASRQSYRKKRIQRDITWFFKCEWSTCNWHVILLVYYFRNVGSCPNKPVASHFSKSASIAIKVWKIWYLSKLYSYNTFVILVSHVMRINVLNNRNNWERFFTNQRKMSNNEHLDVSKQQCQFVYMAYFC